MTALLATLLLATPPLDAAPPARGRQRAPADPAVIERAVAQTAEMHAAIQMVIDELSAAADRDDAATARLDRFRGALAGRLNQRAARGDGSQPELDLWVGRTYLRTGPAALASRHLARASAATPFALPPGRRAEALRLLAESRQWEGERGPALLALREAIALLPDEAHDRVIAETAVALAEAERGAGEHDQAPITLANAMARVLARPTPDPEAIAAIRLGQVHGLIADRRFPDAAALAGELVVAARARGSAREEARALVAHIAALEALGRTAEVARRDAELVGLLRDGPPIPDDVAEEAVIAHLVSRQEWSVARGLLQAAVARLSRPDATAWERERIATLAVVVMRGLGRESDAVWWEGMATRMRAARGNRSSGGER